MNVCMVPILRRVPILRSGPGRVPADQGARRSLPSDEALEPASDVLEVLIRRRVVLRCPLRHPGDDLRPQRPLGVWVAVSQHLIDQLLEPEHFVVRATGQRLRRRQDLGSRRHHPRMAAELAVPAAIRQGRHAVLATPGYKLKAPATGDDEQPRRPPQRAGRASPPSLPLLPDAVADRRQGHCVVHVLGRVMHRRVQRTLEAHSRRRHVAPLDAGRALADVVSTWRDVTTRGHRAG